MFPSLAGRLPAVSALQVVGGGGGVPAHAALRGRAGLPGGPSRCSHLAVRGPHRLCGWSTDASSPGASRFSLWAFRNPLSAGGAGSDPRPSSRSGTLSRRGQRSVDGPPPSFPQR